MLYVFVDESGDLGFTKKSTSYYITASVETRNLLGLSRIIKKVRKTLGKRKKNIPEFKFAKSDEVVRERLLKRAVKEELLFSAVILQKQMVYNYLRDRKDKLYNYLAGFIAESLSNEYDNESEFIIIVDKFIMREEKRREFDEYLKYRLLNSYKHSTKPKIEIIHGDSQQYPGLQVADFIAGAIFQYYEHGKHKFYEIIKPKLRLELRKWF